MRLSSWNGLPRDTEQYLCCNDFSPIYGSCVYNVYSLISGSNICAITPTVLIMAAVSVLYCLQSCLLQLYLCCNVHSPIYGSCICAVMGYDSDQSG